MKPTVGSQNVPLESAGKWLDGLLRAVRTLSGFPGRCLLAPENDAFEEEIRQLLYGDYRVRFTVDGRRVSVLHVRHGARRHLASDDASEGA